MRDPAPKEVDSFMSQFLEKPSEQLERHTRNPLYLENQQLRDRVKKLRELLRHHHERDIAEHQHYPQTELFLRTQEALNSSKEKDL